MEQTTNIRKKVLVVEDEPAIAMVCVRTLTGEGFCVDVAVNGVMALDMWDKGNYDLCLSDIRTPEMSGIELYQRVMIKHPEAMNKFIFATGDVLSNNVKDFLDETKRPYLTKPFTPGELRIIIKTAVATG